MGYPYGDTYLEQIQKHKQECEDIHKAYYVLVGKYCRDNDTEDISLSLKESFSLLGEAIELQSVVLSGKLDLYHFMWDVLDELFTVKGKDNADSINDLN